MEGAWPIIFLAVVLKIPVFFGLWLVWYAVKAEPEIADDPDGAGEHDPGFRRWRREPKRPPRGPRRGPHGGAARALPDCPPGGRTREPLTARRPERKRVSA